MCRFFSDDLPILAAWTAKFSKGIIRSKCSSGQVERSFNNTNRKFFAQNQKKNRLLWFRLSICSYLGKVFFQYQPIFILFPSLFCNCSVFFKIFGKNFATNWRKSIVQNLFLLWLFHRSILTCVRSLRITNTLFTLTRNRLFVSSSPYPASWKAACTWHSFGFFISSIPNTTTTCFSHTVVWWLNVPSAFSWKSVAIKVEP